MKGKACTLRDSIIKGLKKLALEIDLVVIIGEGFLSIIVRSSWISLEWSIIREGSVSKT